MHKTFAAVFMFCLCAGPVSKADTADWAGISSVSNRTGNISFLYNWKPDRGMHIQVSSLDGKKSVTIELKRDDARIRLSPEKEFPPGLAGGGQFNLEALPSDATNGVETVIKIRQETWAIHVNDRPVAIVPAPFTEAAGIKVLQSELPEPAGRAVKFQRVDDFRFDDSFLVPEDQEQKLSQWDIVTGSWQLHTALESAMERHTYPNDRKSDPKKILKPAFSPNFYSLKGAGSNSIIAAGYDFYDSYSVESSVQAMPGEMGLVFHLKDNGGFHAFTIRMPEDSTDAILRLWKIESRGQPGRVPLAAVTTRITHGQWIKLRIKTFQNRIQCFMDNVKLIDMPSELGVGGKFGLFADTQSGTRFDDFSARSNHDLDFLSVNDIRRYTLMENGSLLPKRRFFFLFPPRDKGNYLDPDRSSDPQWIVVGSPEHAGHVIHATFDPDSKQGSAGLLTGYTGAESPYWRFTRKWTQDGEYFVLEEVKGSKAVKKEELSIPAGQAAPPEKQFTLMCDTTAKGEIRLYRNNELVLIHYSTGDVRGASGLYVGADTKVKISDPEYKFERESLYKNRSEKNKMYVDDPFMKQWASPEGQWIEEPDKTTWHKGDFFGRFNINMPYVDNTEIHLSVPENRTNGEFVVLATNSTLRLIAGADIRNPASGPLATAGLSDLVSSVYYDGTNPPAEKDKATEKHQRWYTVSYEGYWLSVLTGNRLLFKQKLDRPLTGRKLRIAGFTTEQLKYSFVERYNVKDYLFTESLFDWTINGGAWEVINRFNCDPRWSHMNGESTNGIAALWTKYNFSGDFCVELFAGIRHGWYQRCGDINITMLNQQTTPSQGYTVTCTGWDPDHSQLYTRFYKNGTQIGTSDKYLVPRFREGNKRKGYEPMVRFGGARDVHGAWYYIKFRRVGRTLEYYFDNELVTTIEDGLPVRNGSFGLWTFLNSMMVARVKIAAEEIKPLSFQFTTVAPDTQLKPAAETNAVFAKYLDVSHDGQTLESCLPQAWEADDPVGNLSLSFHEDNDSGPYFVARNIQGSGDMHARYRRPPLPCASIAGWQFKVKRTEKAQFDFHFSVGRMKDGVYAAEKNFYHRISGADLAVGNCRKTGATQVKGLEAADSNWHTTGDWTPVEVWIPADEMRNLPNVRELMVRVEGFGLLQPSFELEGLSGNAPGESYAIRDFSGIRCKPPVFTVNAAALPQPSFCILNPKTGRKVISCPDVAALNDWIKSFQSSGLARIVLQTCRTNSTAVNELAWLQLPAKPEFSCGWHDTIPNAVLVTGNTQYPDPRLAVARISYENTQLTVENAGPGRLVALLPRKEPADHIKPGTYMIRVTTEAGSESFALSRKLRPVQEPPVLVSLDGATPFLENFEKRELTEPLSVDRKRMKLMNLDPVQGSYLQVFNRDVNQRMKSSFHSSVKLSRYPLLQFRYKGPTMAKISIGLGSAYFAAFTEQCEKAVAVRHEGEPKLDEQWHTWCGIVSDSIKSSKSVSQPFSIYDTSLGSFEANDQTGRYTSWSIDDLVYGPAVSGAEALACTPSYFSHDSITGIMSATGPGSRPYADLGESERRALTWKTSANGVRIVPEITGLSNGINHLFIKAQGESGLESMVTDIPFLLSKEAPATSASFEKTDSPVCNGSLLSLTLDTHGGAPVDIDAIRLRMDDREYPIHAFGSAFIHTPARDRLDLNWAYLFREALNGTTNGQTVRIGIANIVDGAGNKAQDVTVPLTIDYSKDNTPPTLLSTAYPDNILFKTAWEIDSENNQYFTGDAGSSTQLVRGTNAAPYLVVEGAPENTGITHTFGGGGWPLASYPYLAFRIRRTSIPTNDTAAFSLTLNAEGQKPLIIQLSGATENTNTVKLSRTITWESNAWESVFINIPAVLTNNIKSGNPGSLIAKSMTLTMTNKTARGQFQVQSVFVFKDSSKAGKAKLNGFDASGIAGMAWTVDGATDLTEFSPVNPGETDNTPGWFVLRLKDKAGNLSTAVRIPRCPPNALPDGAAVIQDTL